MPLAGGLYYHLNQGASDSALPVVLLHGAGGMYLHWPAEIRRMAQANVYALDLPGHGKSNAKGGQQTIDAYVESVQLWMQAIGLHRVVVVGHSMGGAIALSLALQVPEQILGLGLVSTGARLRVHPELLTNAASATTFYKVVDQLIDWSYAPDAPERLVQLARQRLNEVRPSVLYGDFLACDGFDVSERISSIHCPVQVICGTADRMTPLRYAQFLADAIPGACLDSIPQAGHMVMLEQPQMVAQSLWACLQRVLF